MITFDEQHLRNGLAGFIQFRRVVADPLSSHGRHGAGRYAPAVGIHHTKLATTVRSKSLPMTQMRNINTRCQRSIHDGLPGLKRNLLSVYRDGILIAGILFYVRTHIAILIQCEPPHRRAG